MTPRPLVLVSGLTVGDYLLWNWSLGANQDVLALVAGLTLPPLAAACVLMIALGLLRVVSRNRGRVDVAHRAASVEARRARARHELRERRALPAEQAPPPVTEPAAVGVDRPAAEPPRKLAA